jgi:AcrR family transcriptional regulator
MNTTLTKGEQTREDILRSAHDLFAKNGFHGTSMRQIADGAGLALGGIYNHFASKEEIFKFVIVEYHPLEQILPNLGTVEGETIADFVRQASHRVIAVLKEKRDYLNIVFIELVEFQARHVGLIATKIFPRAMQFAGAMFGKKGKMRTKNVPMMLLLFLAMVFIYFLITNFLDQKTIGKMVKLDLDEMVDIYLYGILKDETEISV